MDSSSVAVYILATDADSPRTTRVSSLFSNPLFSTNVMIISPPSGLQPNSEMTHEQQVETYRLMWCLKDAKDRYSDSPLIVIKDTSVCVASPSRVADIVSAAVNNGQWHICYLSKWLDRCDLYSDKQHIKGTTTVLAKTMSPNGLQAIIFTPIGRDIILGDAAMKNGKSFQPVKKPLGAQLHDAIVNGNLEATCTVPNLVNFDILAAEKPEDYLKTHECLVPKEMGKKNLLMGTGTTSAWWLLLVIILVIAVIAFLVWQKKII